MKGKVMGWLAVAPAAAGQTLTADQSGSSSQLETAGTKLPLALAVCTMLHCGAGSSPKQVGLGPVWSGHGSAPRLTPATSISFPST